MGLRRRTRKTVYVAVCGLVKKFKMASLAKKCATCPSPSRPHPSSSLWRGPKAKARLVGDHSRIALSGFANEFGIQHWQELRLHVYIFLSEYISTYRLVIKSLQSGFTTFYHHTEQLLPSVASCASHYSFLDNSVSPCCEWAMAYRPTWLLEHYN
jgi:hypothetical protein